MRSTTRSQLIKSCILNSIQKTKLLQWSFAVLAGKAVRLSRGGKGLKKDVGDIRGVLQQT